MPAKILGAPAVLQNSGHKGVWVRGTASLTTFSFLAVYFSFLCLFIKFLCSLKVSTFTIVTVAVVVVERHTFGEFVVENDNFVNMINSGSASDLTGYLSFELSGLAVGHDTSWNCNTEGRETGLVSAWHFFHNTSKAMVLGG